VYREDLELARRCAAGDEQAWERFILEFRPLLYRAADALDSTGGARELADSLYADLFGVQPRSGERRSLFHYYEGRSSLATWLRAVLSQRYVDRLRAARRLEPLPDDDREPEGRAAAGVPIGSGADLPDPDRPHQLARLREALSRAVAGLPERDRLRLKLYYAQELTLAEIGRILHEHESNASRNLARTRRAIRHDVERQLRDEAGFTDRQIAECFEAAAADPGPLDVDTMFAAAERKKSARGRSLS
jgi:RNA polymerase sigma-70 factor, ECF subfamily